MGFRTYLMSVPKTVWLEYKDKTEEEFDNFHDLPNIKELCEIGKSWDFDDEKMTSRFFTHEMDWESDMIFNIGSKEFLKEIIENYRQKIVKYHRDLWETVKDLTTQELREFKLKRITNSKMDENDIKIREFQSYFREKLAEWDDLRPYYLDDELDSITSSWKYEYVIFELVRIYKTFDWENNLLIWAGW